MTQLSFSTCNKIFVSGSTGVVWSDFFFESSAIWKVGTQQWMNVMALGESVKNDAMMMCGGMDIESLEPDIRS